MPLAPLPLPDFSFDGCHTLIDTPRYAYACRSAASFSFTPYAFLHDFHAI
jgi:hypothetical protein